MLQFISSTLHLSSIIHLREACTGAPNSLPSKNWSDPAQLGSMKMGAMCAFSYSLSFIHTVGCLPNATLLTRNLRELKRPDLVAPVPFSRSPSNAVHMQELITRHFLSSASRICYSASAIIRRCEVSGPDCLSLCKLRIANWKAAQISHIFVHNNVHAMWQ